jgi:hypothetical protein
LGVASFKAFARIIKRREMISMAPGTRLIPPKDLLKGDGSTFPLELSGI